jgi:hypothetical protein
MRRMARQLFTLCSALSLLLAVVAACAWGVTSSRRVNWEVETARNDYKVSCVAGRLLVRWMQNKTPNWKGMYNSAYTNVDKSFLGFGYNAAPTGQPGSFPGRVWASHGVVMVPFWFVTVACLALPAGWLATARRHGATPAGRPGACAAPADTTCAPAPSGARSAGRPARPPSTAEPCDRPGRGPAAHVPRAERLHRRSITRPRGTNPSVPHRRRRLLRV